MIFTAKTITLKNGATAILKSPEVADAEQFIEFIGKAYGETEFLTRYPEEWNMPLEKEEAWINRLNGSPDSMAIACYMNGRVMGNCEISFNTGMKTAHRASIAISLLREVWDLGIGTAMMEDLINAAEVRGVEIVELEFVEGNERAKHLYEKFGFRVVSERPDIFKLKDGTYRKELYMQKRM